MRFLHKFSFLILLFCGFLIAQNEQPENIIILIGDGMGINTVSISILSDDKSPFSEFSSVGFSVTTALDNLITDSAAGATAIATGHKTNNGYISLSPSGENLKTIFEEAKEKGMSTGLVVTSSVTHATPAAFYAHNVSRENEIEIGAGMLTAKIDVAIGAGTKFFKQWAKDTDKLLSEGYKVYTEASALIESTGNEKLVALLDPESLAPASKRNYTLSQLVKKALDVLSEKEKGFILMIEGSQIDWAAHENDTPYLFAEMNDFTEALKVVLDFSSNNSNTLVVVTADHETGGVTVTDGELNGDKLKIEYNTLYHTAGVVPVFAKGPGEEKFRGVYQNNVIGQRLFELIGNPKK